MITYGSTTLTSYNSIVKTEVYYYKSTSATSLSGGSWSTTKPTWENGKYIWQKIRTVYEDGTHSESDPVNITGQQGATGTAAYSYKLNSSDSIIGKTKDGEYTIKKITFSATSKQGSGAVSAYSGRFKIESTTNGSTWKTEYTSSGNESSKEFTIPNNIIAIKCSLYQSGGTTVLLDIVTVPVVKDGVDAIGLRDSIPYYLASNKDTGITRLTQGWTRYRPQLTAEKKYLWVYYVSRYSEGTTEPELIEIKDDLVHFENNGDESPVESCVVDIEPVQDLHGYDSPWPAGGNVNKITVNRLEGLLDNYNPDTKRTFEYDKYYIGLSFNNYYKKSLITEYSVGNNTVSLKTTRNAYGIAFPVAVTPNTEYFIGATYNGTSRIAVSFFDVDGGLISYSTLPVGESKAITTPNECVTCVLVVYDNAASGQTVGVTDVFFNSPSSETSYTPYSNICPITGWTGCEIWDDSKYGKTIWWNQLAEYPIFASPFTVNGITWTKNNDNSVTVVGTVAGYTNSYIQITDNKEAVVGHKYYIYSGSESGKVLIWYNGAGGIGPSVRNIGTITSIANGFYLRVNGEGTTVNETVKPQIFDLTEMFGVGNEPSTIEEFRALFPKGYYPYNEGEQTCVSAVNGDIYKHISITFPSEAGTVYGGTLDVTTGRLIVDKASTVVISNNLSNNGSLDNKYKVFYRVTGRAFTKNVLCNYFNQDTAMLNHMYVRTNSTGIEFTIQNDLIGVDASADDNSVKLPAAKVWFTNNPVQLVYELATPITYQLTPQEITMLCQENSIFADTGQTAISYYDNQTSTDPYVDYSLTSAFDASTIEPAYIETEWVESTGKQYVYLDWKPPIKTWGFEIDFISYNALGTSAGAWNEDTNKNGYGTIFGVRNASGVNNAQLSSYSNGLLRIGNGANQATGFKTNHTRQQIKLQNTTITKTDGTTSTVSRLDETANKPYCNMTVFGLHEGLRRAGNGGISEPSSTRIYSLKFYDGNTLTVDLVGAIRKRDSVTGLYDKVSKHFYPAPGMLFGDVIGDIGDSISMKEAMDKANPQTIVVNKDRTRMWEATVPFNDLQDGQKITVTYSYGNIVSSVETGELIGWDDTSNNQQVYLKLTFADGHKTDWIPCYYSNTGRLTTHYGAGIPIQLTYRENILANASETASGNMVLRGFYADANYDTNNTDIVRWSYGRVIAGSNKIFPYSIIMQNADERWESIVTSSTTAKTKTRNTHGFRLDTILYQAANTTTNENAENTSWQLRTGDPLMDMRYNLNIEDTNELRLVHGKSVYLVGTVGTDGLFYLADQWWSQSLPTTEDGKIYIFLGQVYDWYRCGLATMHPIYKFVDGKLKSTLQIAVDALDKAKEVAQDLTDLGADLQAQIDGKIETWCQSTDPSTAWTTTELKNQHNGDLWYYIGESTSSYKNNTTYKYTASTNKWSAYSASTDLFDKIDTKASIYYGKPSAVTQNLEVGDYLVDNTDGCSYRWDGSKWVKLTDYKTTITNAIDEIEIGGRNLIWRSNWENMGNKWSNWGTPTIREIVTINGKKWLHLKTSGSKFQGYSQDSYRRNGYGEIKEGDNITVSFTAYAAENNITACIGMHWIHPTSGIVRQDWVSFTLSTSPTRYSKVLTVSGTGVTGFNIMVGDDSTDIKEIWITDIKVEKGNKATDWTPAPEDVDASIATAQSTADTAMDRATAIYGTCSTDSIVDAKVVVCPDFVLFDGVRIQVAFENANSTTVPSINVNNTGAKQILINQATVSESNQLLWAENAQLEFVYDGTYWVLQNAPYSLYGICSVTEEIPAKVIECAEAVICKGTTITVDFMYSNTSDNTVFNVANIAQKPLLVNGDTLKVNSRFNWHAGAVRTFYFDGQAWNMSDDIVSAYIDEYETEQDEDGIMVHPVGQKNTGWSIGSTLELLKNGVSYIKMWFDKVEEGEFSLPFIRIGKESGNHVLVGDDAVTIREDQKELAHYSSLGITFDDETPYKIGNDTTYIAFEDTDNDAKADSLRIVADSISFHSNGTEKDLRTELESLTENVDLNTQAIEQNSEIIENTQRYIQINPEVPSIKLATNDRNYLLIESNKLGFWVDANETAYMSQNQMNIPTASITNLLMQTTNAETGESIGQIGWVMRTNGHLSLKIMN